MHLAYVSTGGFTCANNTQSPLSGATYKKSRALKKCGGILYVCTKGYGSRVPPRLVNGYYECESEYYRWACEKNNTATFGTVNSTNVVVRKKPRTQSGKVFILKKGTKVHVLQRVEKCLTIDSEQGQWIKIRVKTTMNHYRSGWVFDAYVDYPEKTREEVWGKKK